MKKILGLDLGINSIGWALVNEAENTSEKSSIIKLGVRVNPLTVDELMNFEKGKSITTNADRTLKRSMRRNLQRYKLRRENLIQVLLQNKFITENTLLSENGNHTTFETLRLRSKAATEKISLEQLGRVFLMINKKRGYKSSRKAKNQEEGQLIDGMEIAMKLYNEQLTPGQFVFQSLQSGNRFIPDFYRSDLLSEFEKVWKFQKQFYPEILSDDFRVEIEGKGLRFTSAAFYKKYGFNTAEMKGSRDEKKLQSYHLRSVAIKSKLTKEEVAFVLAEINNNLNASSGYLGSISDRSKELYFNKKTVGEYLMAQLDTNPHTKLKNQVFYRQDYLDEFDKIWETQKSFHDVLTPELKKEIRDIIIFYQRRLKSQKGLVSICEFESHKIEIEIEGKRRTKTIGPKVCPKSSPLFQEFKIWQVLNNLEISERKTGLVRPLEPEEKNILFSELMFKKKLKKTQVLKLLFNNFRELDLNYEDIEGNRTMATLYEAYNRIIELSGHGEHDFDSMSASEIKSLVFTVFSALEINTEILTFSADSEEYDKQSAFLLWHLLYSYEGDNSPTGNDKLVHKLQQRYGFERNYAIVLANISFQDDYSSLSSKAIRKILPFLQGGNKYSDACEYAGYRHSKSSLTKEELDKKELKNQLAILPKNSLRNPVVEKILNQMINVVNTISEKFGKPDEIRIELARELKKNAKEREELTRSMNENSIEHEKYRTILSKEFGLTHVSRNDIIRYKLYLELAPRGYRTLYSDTYIPQEKLFGKEFDIEHIIPQSRLFDDSFSNKTLEKREVNIEKDNDTAYDYMLKKYGETAMEQYLERVETLFGNDIRKKAKLKKLKMKGSEIPDGFIERDIRDTQYIARKAKTILEEMVRQVVSTSGSVTSRLREDWQLIDVMQELNWDKYDVLGLTETFEGRDGQRIRHIKDWTKRNDHRHHAMDALTIAFTKHNHIHYLNNLNAHLDKTSVIYAIQQKELYRDERGKLRFKPPMPLDEFRAEAKSHLASTLVSIKAKNKVVTSNINTSKGTDGKNRKKQMTPRGQLHLETVYGSIEQYVTHEEKVGSQFNEEHIARVAKKSHREAMLTRLAEFDNDPKLAFTGKNSLEKNPLWLDELHTTKVPEKVKLVGVEKIYTIRKDITPDLKIEKVVDPKIRLILEERLKEFGGDPKKAFSNLSEQPIWLNKEKGISIKRVTITGISNAIALHDKKDKEGRFVLDKEGRKQAVDFVNTGNNHHVAIYRDEQGNLQENVVSFFEATTRANQGLPIVDRDYRKAEGWTFLFTMKQNEYFVFPNEKTGFNPNEIDLLNPENYHLISPNLFRVQTMSKVMYGNSIIRDYKFRHNFETTVKDVKELQNITYKQYKSLDFANSIVKVRINHIGQIVSIGEY